MVSGSKYIEALDTLSLLKFIYWGKISLKLTKGDEETETALAHPGDKGSGTFPTRK